MTWPRFPSREGRRDDKCLHRKGKPDSGILAVILQKPMQAQRQSEVVHDGAMLAGGWRLQHGC